MKKNKGMKLLQMRTITSLTLLVLLGSPSLTQGYLCGNGIQETGEACDDGNKINYDGCAANCLSTETGFTCVAVQGSKTTCTENCGDGKNFRKLSRTAECDDGDNDDGDGCSSTCETETGYTCSGGSRTTPDTCKETCGDGYNFDTSGTGQPGDACDDANRVNYDGCSYKCVVEDGWYCTAGSASDTDSPTVCYEECNDGLDFGTFPCDTDGDTTGCQDCVVTTGWECSGGSYNSPDTCTEICGDGYHYYEQCDDGNELDDDGCSSNCEVEDGFYFADLEGTYAYNVADIMIEECDGYDYGFLDCDCGNSDDGCDGCSYCEVVTGYRCQTGDSNLDTSVCTEICGDGYNYAEDTYCDDGNLRSGDGCSKTCVIETGFTCDFTNYNTADDCYEICGDGLDYGHYPCDDGNSNEYDGCNSDCDILDGWYCYGGSKTAADTCYEMCGDGRNYGRFECDDGNEDSGDGCSSGCDIESGYTCSGGGYDTADFCHEICGDGYHMTDYYDCDDGNTDSGDGCSSDCLIEDGFVCSGGNAVTADYCYEECGDGMRYTTASDYDFCDDGNNVDDDGCDSDCNVETGFYCEGGSQSQPDTCYEICGDGYVFDELNCDDGNNDDGDGCSSDCDVETGYDCYGGDTNTADTCYEICGDGYNMGLDECDDENNYDMDGCDEDCYVEDGWYCYGGTHSSPDSCYETCGDGYHYYYEQGYLECDDGNTDNVDGCDSSCLIEDGWYCSTTWTDYDLPTTCTEICGDGIRFNSDSDYCDTGTNSGALEDGCNMDCSVEDGWYCYGGDDTSADGCYEICGDAYNFGNFDCDDGDTTDGDGCSSDCFVEDGWYCYVPSSGVRRLAQTADLGNDVCYEICGDTNYDHNFGNYACQDSNINDGDGCTSDCEVEDGFYCYGGDITSSDTCYEICGDDYDLRLLDCDDGNDVDYDGCTGCVIDDGYYCVESTTLVSGYSGAADAYETAHCYDICGDGYLMDKSLYACDDGNNANGDGCNSKCQIERGYKCEGGDHFGADSCSEVCGDSMNMPLTSGDCDDGNTVNGDGCDHLCVIEDGWYCYGGSTTKKDSCYEECGDGYDWGSFDCDDGNTVDGDGCSSDCDVEDGWYCFGGTSTSPDTCYDVCGDGVRKDDGVTECDDATHSDPYDGCNNCEVVDGWYCYGGTDSTPDVCKEISGDGMDFGQYACDNYDNGTFDGCLNGQVIDGYYCYGGSRTNGGDKCYEICGDGKNPSDMDGTGNDCDDGDTTSGDGCSSSCLIEDGYYCYGGSSSNSDTCYEICGDGLIKDTYVCDDGDNVSGDGCSADCTVETGYDCDDSEPTVCTEICGDGLNFGQYECDDGDVHSGDGCSSTCDMELGYECTGGTHSQADTCTQLDFITPSVDDCQEYAANFFQTCDTDTAPTFAAMGDEEESCDSGYGNCIGTVDDDGICSWNRKLCVTCTRPAGYVMIRVQTNTLPDHCYNAPYQTPTTNNIDFEVAFSAQNFKIDLPYQTVTTQAELDQLLCASEWPSSYDTLATLESLEYTENSGTDVDKIVGVALNGVPFFSGVSELGMDAYQPRSYNGVKAKAVAPDTCLGSNRYTAFYHYYSASPCILDGLYKENPEGAACSDDSDCSDDMVTYMANARRSQKTQMPIGIARDGHKIYGPYDSNGDLWDPCDVDVCNGLTIDGEYAYVLTYFFPYTVGCFSTGYQPTLYASCSKNPRICGGASYISMEMAFMLLMAMFLLFLQ